VTRSILSICTSKDDIYSLANKEMSSLCCGFDVRYLFEAQPLSLIYWASYTNLHCIKCWNSSVASNWQNTKHNGASSLLSNTISSLCTVYTVEEALGGGGGSRDPPLYDPPRAILRQRLITM
jgi:hypothetical protein